MKPVEFASSRENICSPDVPNKAPYANGATHKTRHNDDLPLFHKAFTESRPGEFDASPANRIFIDGACYWSWFRETTAYWTYHHHVGRRATIYVMRGAGLCKIGRATCVQSRLSAIQGGSPVRIKLRRTRKVPSAGVEIAERWLHWKFRHCRRHGEWFNAEVEAIERKLDTAASIASAYELFCRYQIAEHPDWIAATGIQPVS